MENPLNNTAIIAAKPGDILNDDKIRGLHLRCFPKRKVFYLSYRTRDGRHQRRPKVGDLGVVTLAQARTIAKELLEQVAAGRDPMVDRKTRRQALTVDELCDRYLTHIRTDPKDKKKPKSIREDEKLINGRIRGRWGRRSAQDVGREDIETLHKEMASTPFLANRTLSLLSRMFNLAEKWRVRSEHSNPCRLIDKYPERKRKRLMTGDEAPAIAAALAKREKDYPACVLFIYLLILTGARPDEIARAKWSDIKGDVLTLTEHKTDGHVEERVIFLPPRAVALLGMMPETTGTITGIKSPRWLWQEVRKECGCEDLRLYDLRRTFASAALRAGYNLDQIGELLGHTSGTTTKRYAWMIEESRAEAATATSRILDGMLTKALPGPTRPADSPPQEPQKR